MHDDGTTKIVVGWMIGHQADLSDRRMLATYWDGMTWQRGLPLFPVSRSGAGSISFRADGGLAACGDADVDGQGYRASLAVETIPGGGTFSYFGTSPDTVGDHPRMAVNPNGTFVITGNSLETFNGISGGVMWDRTDQISGFDGWEHFSDIAPDWMDDNMEPPAICAGTNGKVGVVIPDLGGSIRLFESTDYGETFDVQVIAPADTAGLPAGLDSTAARLGWINSDITYFGDEPHVVWTAGQGAKFGGDYGILDFKATIFHWSPSTGIDTVAVASTQSTDPTRDDYVPTPWNHLSVDWPSIGLAVDGRTIVVANTALSPDDIDPTAFLPTGYLDIRMATSTDDGQTWTDPQNVTNPDGAVLGQDDRYPSVAKVNVDSEADPGKDVYMVYQSDDRAGTYVQGWEGGLNMDYIKFIGVDLEAVGIGGGRDGGPGPGLPGTVALFQNHPNPFNPSTTIDYAIGERSRVTLGIFDIRGRLVRSLVDREIDPGNYSTTWDGLDQSGRTVPSGVYFCKMETDDTSEVIRKMVLLK